MFRTLHNTARVFGNRTAKEAKAIEVAKGPELQFSDLAALVSGKRGRQAEKDEDPEAGIWTAGQVVGLIDDIPSVKELVQRMVREAESTVTQRLQGMIKSKL